MRSEHESAAPSGALQYFLDVIEWVGNKLPDPALLFVWALFITWGLSAVLASVQFTELDPRSNTPIEVKNQLTETSLVAFTSRMVKTFIEFPPLGLVLVALLGVGVAEHSGFVSTALRGMLSMTPASLLTPMLLLVAILSHSAGDSGYVLIIPLGGMMFAAAGRHPLLGITTAFAGTAGGFSANFLPSALDPLLQGFTQQAVRLIDADRVVNPLCNWGFMSASCLVIVLVGWYVSDQLIEPRLKRIPVDGEKLEASAVGDLTAREKKGLWVGFTVLALGLLLLTQRVITPELLFPTSKGATEAADTEMQAEVPDSNATLRRLLSYVLPSKSAWHSEKGELVSADAPLMQSIVPLIFLLFLLPGTAYGYVAGTLKGHRDVVAGMTKSMGTISYYLVMAFFAAQFTAAFKDSNLGVLLAIKGANLLEAWNLEPQYTILGIITFTSLVNLIIGSASAKWALLGPIFVPMLMRNGISPELTQGAYRIGDSSMNIITPLMPYFPLIVVYCQRYCKSTGIGTLVSLMMPYSLAFVVTWSILLMIFWRLGLPLGINAPYTYP